MKLDEEHESCADDDDADTLRNNKVSSENGSGPASEKQSWEKFTIWGAGRDGKDFLNQLSGVCSLN